MLTRAAHILALADELRARALRDGYDLNSAHLFAHRYLMRALCAQTDLAALADELRGAEARKAEPADAAAA